MTHDRSNFLLWQCAYAELFFSEKLWPDFHREDFESIVAEYSPRHEPRTPADVGRLLLPSSSTT